MGTFGTGPFGSDGALDLLDELSGQPVQRRAALLRQMFAQVSADPDLLGRKIFPDEIVAAAAIVAAALPDGARIQELLLDAVDAPDAVTLPAGAEDLAALALRALLLAAGPNGPWLKGWTTETSRGEAQRTIDGLVAILRAAGA